MKKIIVRIFLLQLALVTLLAAEEKQAQTGMQFLSVSTDGRGSALAGSMTARSAGSLGLIYNPATMAVTDKSVDLTASQNTFIADITHNALTFSYRPGMGQFGVIGVSVMQVNYGEFQGTAVAANDQGYVDTEVFNPTALALGVGYARSLTDKFSVGGQIKYVGQNLGKSIVPFEDEYQSKTNAIASFAFDFGTIYRTGFKSLDFGMSVRNFSQEIKYEDEGFQMPLTFTMGLGMNVLDLLDMDPAHKLNVTVDAVHYRSHREQINLGFEYALMNMFYGRLGYSSSNDLNDITYGVGISQFGLSFDYAMTPYGVFGNVQRITLAYNF